MKFSNRLASTHGLEAPLPCVIRSWLTELGLALCPKSQGILGFPSSAYLGCPRKRMGLHLGGTRASLRPFKAMQLFWSPCFGGHHTTWPWLGHGAAASAILKNGNFCKCQQKDNITINIRHLQQGNSIKAGTWALHLGGLNVTQLQLGHEATPNIIFSN